MVYTDEQVEKAAEEIRVELLQTTLTSAEAAFLTAFKTLLLERLRTGKGL